jgi:apolipoprotein N-acyltransferase
MSLSSLSPRRSAWRLILLSLLAGYAQAVSIAAPWNGQPLWWLQLLSLAALVMLLDRTSSAKQAAFVGWVFATSWLCGTVWWLFISMHIYGGLAAPLAALAVFALCGFLALYYAAASYFYKRFRQVAGMNPAWSAIVFAGVWMLAELARDTWFTGFPWGAGGYAHVDGPLKWLAAGIGVYGVGWVSAAFPAWVALWLTTHNRKTWKSWLGISLILAGVMGLGYLGQAAAFIDYYFPDGRPSIHAAQTPRTDIALLQGNIPQGEKFDPTTGVKASLDWYQEQLLGANPTLVITPETAIPLLPRQLPDGYWEAIQKRFSIGDQAALVGVPLGDFDKGYTNSMLGLKPNQAQPYQYDKHHLVPFGEFIPPLFKWFTQMMNIPLGDFNRGTVGQPSFEWAGQRWALNICYEDLFGDELARRFTDEKTAPTVMVNVSNIGWFGNTVAIDQHLQISRMRALELGRPMVRATNTGATVIINHRGEVTHTLPRHTRGVLTGSVEGRQGLTPFVRWASVYGLWPLWMLGTTIVLIAFSVISMPANGRKSIKNTP